MPPLMSPARRVSGTLSLHARGFGFLNVEPEAGQPARSAFIPPPELNGLLADDRISAVLQQGQDGRLSASEVQLESRLRTRLVERSTVARARFLSGWTLSCPIRPCRWSRRRTRSSTGILSW